jgi:hypothetical protein
MNNKTKSILWLLFLAVCYITCKKENKTQDTISPGSDLTGFKSVQPDPNNNSFTIALGFNGKPGAASPLWFLAKR